MRISDRQTSRDFLKHMDTAKNNVASTKERIASGNRFVRISEDVSAATKALRARVEKAKTEDRYENVKSVGEQLSTTENAMNSITSILSNVNEKALAAMNGTSGASGREAIANQITAMRDQVLQLINTKYDSVYVLGGSGAGEAPFTVSDSGKLLFNGIDLDTISGDAKTGYFFESGGGGKVPLPMNGDIFVDIGLGLEMIDSSVKASTAMQSSYSGVDIVGFGTNADGKSQNIFNMLTELAASIKGNDTESMSSLQGRVSTFSNKFTGYLTDVGAKSSYLDTIETRLKQSIDTFDTQINRLVGIDDAQEASQASMNEYVLKAVLSMGANILPTSLMEFLR